jgi:hypothetical protein
MDKKLLAEMKEAVHGFALRKLPTGRPAKLST